MREPTTAEERVKWRRMVVTGHAVGAFDRELPRLLDDYDRLAAERDRYRAAMASAHDRLSLAANEAEQLAEREIEDDERAANARTIVATCYEAMGYLEACGPLPEIDEGGADVPRV